MTEQIHRAKINKSNDRTNTQSEDNKSNDRTNTQSEDKQVKWQNKYTERRSLCVFVLSFDLFIFALCICSVIRLVYLRSVYLFCHLTCLSSFCVFVLSMTEQIHRAKINKSNDRTNTQSEDKQVELQNKYAEHLFIFALFIWSVIWLVYLRSVYLFCHLTCLSSLCVFVLSFDLFIFALCIEQIHRTKIYKSNYRTNTQSEDKQVKLQHKYTERR
jgi:uncharacterized ion transporter superfamily protein YfcC